MNLGSGNITHRGRKMPIVWTGQFAEHVADTYINEKSVHHFLHVDIQQMCQKANFIKDKNSVFVANVIKNNLNYLIVGEIHLNIFYPKTCYRV